MLTSTLISSSLYNSLPTIDEQLPPSQTQLEHLGELLVRHGVNKHLGISLLHRHYDLVNGSAMVHNGLRCSPTPIVDASPNLSGTSFFLHENSFCAFEYEHGGARANVPPEFLRELAQYLIDSGLENKIALSMLDSQAPKLMEYCEGGSHICEVTQDEIPPLEATEWRFDTLNGSAVPFITRGCRRSSTIEHQPKR